MSEYTFRMEMHMHTSEASPCGKASAAEGIARCLRLGYHGCVITDHFKARTEQELLGINHDLPWREKIDLFLSGYRNAKAAAPNGFPVLLGVEIRFKDCHPGSENDYTVYGVTEEMLYANEGLYDIGLPAFRRFAQAHGLFVVQAHPFRFDMTHVKPKYLDGMEVYNSNPHHDENNDFAALWADRYGLLPLSGSDYHGDGPRRNAAGQWETFHKKKAIDNPDAVRNLEQFGEANPPGGLAFCQTVSDNAALLTALRNRDYRLIGTEI
ncbi:MAG: PHP domain-containing protein [Oscillospiraceae bacterium]|jgi:hypothetical protein|nr:PHP domain-containing protein [Oscillospiraceae bacterium]